MQVRRRRAPAGPRTARIRTCRLAFHRLFAQAAPLSLASATIMATAAPSAADVVITAFLIVVLPHGRQNDARLWTSFKERAELHRFPPQQVTEPAPMCKEVQLGSAWAAVFQYVGEGKLEFMPHVTPLGLAGEDPQRGMKVRKNNDDWSAVATLESQHLQKSLAGKLPVPICRCVSRAFQPIRQTPLSKGVTDAVERRPSAASDLPVTRVTPPSSLRSDSSREALRTSKA